MRWLISLWKKASIRIKFLAFFMIIILCEGLFSFYSIHSLTGIVESYDKHMLLYANISRFQKERDYNAYYLSEYMVNQDMEQLHLFNVSVDQLQEVLAQMRTTAKGEEEQILLRAISNTYLSYYEGCIEVIKRKRDGDTSYYTYLQQTSRISQYVDLYVSQLTEQAILRGMKRKAEIYEEASTAKNVAIVGRLGMIMLGILIALLLSSRITKPIKQLANSAGVIASGKLDVDPIPIQSGDEIGRLAASFNIMSCNTIGLVKDLKRQSELERLLEESKFLALQSQINPHFLFNTLNTISRVITFGEKEQGTELIEALSHILRYNLKQDNHLAHLGEEVDCIRQYLFIQKYRFGNRITCHIDIAEEINPTKVLLPRFTLQPLVENAIIHGLEPKEEGGCLTIQAGLTGDKILIQLMDNGIGMDESTLLAIQSGSSVKGHTTGIGMHNVKNRIHLYTHDSSSFKMESRLGGGTVITLVLEYSDEMRCS